MREPGASEVLMCGRTLKPFSTAFLAKRPAASSTPGLDVLVQLVMAAISTSPLPMAMLSAVRSSAGGGASETAVVSVGLFASISYRNRAAPAGVGGVEGGLSA